MPDLYFTLLGDGSSDRILLRHLRWLLLQHVRLDVALQAQWADLSLEPSRPRSLVDRIEAAARLYPCDILFVHRDAEREPRETRDREVRRALEQFSDITGVPVIPVRMQEAWLLFDLAAIRNAAGNPNGSLPASLPPLRRIEDNADPKTVLYELLRQVSGLSGRRLRRFQPSSHAIRVADFIDDFSPLRAVPAFAALEEDILKILEEQGWTVHSGE